MIPIFWERFRVLYYRVNQFPDYPEAALFMLLWLVKDEFFLRLGELHRHDGASQKAIREQEEVIYESCSLQ
jgi:hypothetical protein